MKFITLHSPIFLGQFSSSKHICQHHKSKPIYLIEHQHYNVKLATGYVMGKRSMLIAPLRAINSPAASGDLSVLLQTGAVMLFMYWIANFVVPQFILKDLQDDSTTNNNKTDEKDLL
ncbi:putative rab3 GTPase-activating protein catalytic subunit-like, partial [Capsicum annuum]